MANVNFQEYIDKIPYDTVQQAASAHFWQLLRSSFRQIWIFALVLVSALIILLVLSLDLRWALLPAIVLVVVVLGSVGERGREIFFRSVAASWDWEYIPAQTAKEFPSSFVKFGSMSCAMHVLRSKSSPAVEIATVYYELGSGNSRKQYRKTAVRVDLDFPVVNLILLDKDVWMGSQLLYWHSGLEELKIDLANQADRQLFVEKKLEIEALQIFSDERLAKLVLGTSGFTVEFVGTDVFIYTNENVATKSDLKHLLEVSQLVLDELVPILSQISGSTRAMQEAKANKGV